MAEKRAALLPQHRFLYACLAMFLLLQFLCAALLLRDQERWLNVPTAPSPAIARMVALGDPQFAFRSLAIVLQNFGDAAGRTISLDMYDYHHVGTWLRLLDGLDPQSRYLPYLAAYYFGAAPDGKGLAPVVDYLAMIGQRQGNNNWRWLAQAVILSQYKLHDLKKAQALADILARHPDPALPEWGRNFRFVIMNTRGEKQAAAALILMRLRDEANTLTITEFNLLRSILCQQILTAAERPAYALCHDLNGKEEEAGDAE
ncbi:MAG: hypothetical protein V4621_07055 [Pseudomonadota bacterium]